MSVRTNPQAPTRKQAMCAFGAHICPALWYNEGVSVLVNVVDTWAEARNLRCTLLCALPVQPLPVHSIILCLLCVKPFMRIHDNFLSDVKA